MQLKNILPSLSAASCALLGTAEVEAAPMSSPKWQIKSAFMMYSEKDRVTALEPSLYATATLADDTKLSMFAVFDSLTGASPNGAAPSLEVQSFTSPSGNTTSETKSGMLPLDESYKDTRGQMAFTYDTPITRNNRYQISANLSLEKDYSSIALGTGYSHDFNNKNTTWSVIGALAFDTIFPEGGVPIPMAVTDITNNNSTNDLTQSKTEHKHVFDLSTGVTQVINKRTLMQWNWGLSYSEGYHTDPYKILSVVDSQGHNQSFITERRPDKRFKQYLYFQTNYHTEKLNTIITSYRYSSDDWGINSNTIDIRYRWNINERWYLQPRYRYYQQSAADFYRHSIVASEHNINFVSADQRLAKLTAITQGLEVGFLLGSERQLSFRFERYRQMGDSFPDNAIGVQQQLNLFQGVEAIIGQISYDFNW